jgi:hypothetical protein
MPESLDPFPDQGTTHARNGRFSCAIHFGQQQDIRG